jgi:hypothetical protein
MTAIHFDQITNADIAVRLHAARQARIEWFGQPPADAEDWHGHANAKLVTLSVDDIRTILRWHDVVGDNANDEIDLAITIAAAPIGLPEEAVVTISFGKK